MLKKLLCAALLLALIMASAQAEILTLPNGITEVEEEAFAGDTSLREVVLPESVTRIGAEAFAGCTGLQWITVPGSAETLGEDWLSGCAGDVLIRTEAGSAACTYAQANSVDYQAGTVYRALLIGQSYIGTPNVDNLYGTRNDALGLAACLGQFQETRYVTDVRFDLTADEMLSAIAESFAGATAQDVSLFFYSGHGLTSYVPSMQGALVGNDNQDIITAAQLRAALDQVPGRKIVIIDACHSGNLITARSASKDAVSAAEAFTASFIDVFSRKSRGLAGDSYFVLAAAAASEMSYESAIDNIVMGMFTSCLLTGCGYQFRTGNFIPLYADANENNVLTLNEIYTYVANRLISDGQHAQVYPAGCTWFGLMRK